MPEKNLCDTHCPYSALIQARQHQKMDKANLFERAKVAAEGVAQGLGMMATAATCPRAHTTAEEWQPSQYCLDQVKEQLKTINTSDLTAWERKTLEPFLPQPPANEQ